MTEGLTEGEWLVTSFLDDDSMVVPALEARLEVTADRIAGTMGVNRLMGRLDGGLPAAPIATTLMAGPPEAMAQEAILLRHLEEADDVLVDTHGMKLTREGVVTVEFVRSGTRG